MLFLCLARVAVVLIAVEWLVTHRKQTRNGGSPIISKAGMTRVLLWRGELITNEIRGDTSVAMKPNIPA